MSLSTYDPLTDTKVCTKCNERKPLHMFVKDRFKPQGRRAKCKRCTNERQNAYRPQWRSDQGKRPESRMLIDEALKRIQENGHLY